MAGWKRRATAAGSIGISTLIAMICALSAPAQQYPQPGPYPLPTDNQARPQPEKIPAIDFTDVNVQPAQYTLPNPPTGSFPASTPGVSDPPAPLVRIQVRVAADSPLDDDVKYIITVRNLSSADAHAVTVRNPLSEGVLQAVKAEPDWDRNKSSLSEGSRKQLIWSFGTLQGGKTKTIELTLRPKPGATEIKNLAYVSFEHGEAVTTRLSKPSIKVSKSASKQTIRDEPYQVRIVVENNGRVIAEDVRVMENVPESAEFEPISRGAKRIKQPTGQQWLWEFDKLMPGERRVVEFRVTARSESEALMLTNVTASKGVEERAEARTKVLVPGLSLKLTGPTGVVNPGEIARYEITVRNTGTVFSTNVAVLGAIPADCKPAMKTEGGQLLPDGIQWMIPRLEPGEAQTFRFGLKAATTNRRTVAATARDARNERAGDELSTMFQGAPSLNWESTPNPPALSTGGQGSFTVKIRNTGGEAARNVQLEVDLEQADAINVTKVTPNTPLNGNKLLFSSEVIPANGTAVYIINYTANRSAQVWFKLKLHAECLGDRPMQTEKAIEITGKSR